MTCFSSVPEICSSADRVGAVFVLVVLFDLLLRLGLGTSEVVLEGAVPQECPAGRGAVTL